MEAGSLQLDERTVFVSRGVISRALERSSLPSRERKKLRNSLSRCDFDSSRSVVNLLLACCKRKVPISNLIGLHLETYKVYGSRNWCRLRHCLGVADATYMAMFNLGIQVRFPQKKRVLRPARMRRTPLPIRFTSEGVMETVILPSTGTRNAKFRLLCHYLRVLPRTRSEVELVKSIKTSFVRAFCVYAGQELPVGDHFPLFPEVTQTRLDRRFRDCRREGIRFYKNILESKSLCAPISDEMIQKAYRDHHDSLCREPSDVLVVPDKMLQELREYGRNVGKEIRKWYNPFSTSLPNTRATVEHSRHRGGARESLRPQISVVRGPLFREMMDKATRPEPWVVGLFGPPGSGKTTSVRSLVSIIKSAFYRRLSDEECVYSRSCSSDHWDGYHGQPIVILDDIGQNLSQRSDLVEFENLVSTNEYILPMADLPDKGQKFVSPFIIVTSNLPYGTRPLDSQGRPVMEDGIAFWRRFHLPLLVFREGGRTRFQQYDLSRIMDSQGEFWGYHHTGDISRRISSSQTEMDAQSGPLHLNSDYQCLYRTPAFSYYPQEYPIRQSRFMGPVCSLDDLFPKVVEGFQRHMDYHADYLSPTWRQNVACLKLDVRQGVAPLFDVDVSEIPVAHEDNEVTASIHFPAFPPYQMPVVDAIAIPEPLKVRMITKAEANTKALQPLQMALFRYLKTKPQFCLAHGVSNLDDPSFLERLSWIEKIEKTIQNLRSRGEEGDLWLSGDYTAATDNFPLSVTAALIEGILESIDHEPTKRWVRYECSPHRIRYPGGVVGDQTSGQLMGSLLSFPLLCFLNDYIVRCSGFQPGKYLINGDDVVALGPPSVIQRWKENAPKVGLSLSIGKNFIDPDFCCINSQLFWKGKVQHTGKVSCSLRYGKTLGYCFSELQYYYGDNPLLREEFIRRNVVPLRQTPRSLDVPTTHGGLALSFSHRANVDLKLAKEVYLYDFLRPFSRSFAVPGYDYLRAVPYPVGIFSDREMFLGGGEPEENRILHLLSSLETDPPDSEQGELQNITLHRFREVMSKHHTRRYNQLLNRDLKIFPSLGEIRSSLLFVQKGKVNFLKNRIRELLLDFLLDQIDHPFDGEVDPDSEIELIRSEALHTVLLDLGGEDDSLESSIFLWNAQVDPDRYQQLLPDLNVVTSRQFYLPHCEGDLRRLQGLGLPSFWNPEALVTDSESSEATELGS
nr:MAG: putative RNA-dependent RNA polymerase [Narnaviridae sp.]